MKVEVEREMIDDCIKQLDDEYKRVNDQMLNTDDPIVLANMFKEYKEIVDKHNRRIYALTISIIKSKCSKEEAKKLIEELTNDKAR